jgi:hypothetical protein
MLSASICFFVAIAACFAAILFNAEWPFAATSNPKQRDADDDAAAGSRSAP